MRLVRASLRPVPLLEGEVKKYLGKLSGPLLDRIDLYVEVPALEFDELAQKPRAESSRRHPRPGERGPCPPGRPVRPRGSDCNAHMGPRELQELCPLDSACQAVMKGAFRMGLTARS